MDVPLTHLLGNLKEKFTTGRDVLLPILKVLSGKNKKRLYALKLPSWALVVLLVVSALIWYQNAVD